MHSILGSLMLESQNVEAILKLNDLAIPRWLGNASDTSICVNRCVHRSRNLDFDKTKVYFIS